MKRLHRILIGSGLVVLCGLIFVPKAYADAYGCRDEKVRCMVWHVYPGTCGFNIDGPGSG